MTTAFTPAGANLTNRYVFNSGTLDFGNSRIVSIDNITVEIAKTITDLFILGSVKAADKVAHSLKVTVTGKLKSFEPELEMAAWGSSVIGVPNNIAVLDGQPTQTSPVVTFFDRNGKEGQYQLLNAVFKSTKFSSTQEAYSEWDFELEAIDIVEVYTA